MAKEKAERFQTNLESVIEEIAETKVEVAIDIFADVRNALAEMGIVFNCQPILCEIEKKYAGE